MRRHLSLLILSWSLALGACGTRGSLTMPPPRTNPPANAPTAAAPAAPSASTATDLSTAKEPAR